MKEYYNALPETIDIKPFAQPLKCSRAFSASCLFMYATKPQFLLRAFSSSVRGHMTLTLASGPNFPNNWQRLSSFIYSKQDKDFRLDWSTGLKIHLCISQLLPHSLCDTCFLLCDTGLEFSQPCLYSKERITEHDFTAATRQASCKDCAFCMAESGRFCPVLLSYRPARERNSAWLGSSVRARPLKSVLFIRINMSENCCVSKENNREERLRERKMRRELQRRLPQEGRTCPSYFY